MSRFVRWRFVSALQEHFPVFGRGDPFHFPKVACKRIGVAVPDLLGDLRYGQLPIRQKLLCQFDPAGVHIFRHCHIELGLEHAGQPLYTDTRGFTDVQCFEGF